MVVAYRSDGNAVQRFAAIDGVLGTRSETLLAHCEAHIASTTNSYLPFLWPCYRSHRATLFRLLRALDLDTTTADDGLKDAVRFLLEHESRTGDWLPTALPRILRGGATARRQDQTERRRGEHLAGRRFALDSVHSIVPDALLRMRLNNMLRSGSASRILRLTRKSDKPPRSVRLVGVSGSDRPSGRHRRSGRSCSGRS